MLNIKCRVKILGLFLAFVLLTAVESSGIGMNAGSVIKDVRVTVGSIEQKYMLFQSLLNPHQWFCALMNPRLVEQVIDGQLEPDMTLLKFQRQDPLHPGQLIEGANLQFAFEIGPTDKALEMLKNKIPRKDSKPVKLAPLPLSGIDLTIYHPRGGKVAVVASPTRGIASAFATKNVSFSIALHKADADIFDGLISGPTGIKYALKYNYAILDAPKAISVKVDVDKLKQASMGKPNRKEIEKSFQVEGAGSLSLDSRLQKIIQLRAQKNARSKSVAKKPVTKEENLLKGKYDGAGPKKQNSDLMKKQLEVIQLTRRVQSSQATMAEGFLGLGKYSDEVREKHVVIEQDTDGWKRAYLVLPSIGDTGDIKIEKVVLAIALTWKKMEFDKKVYTWTPDKRWRDENNAPVLFAQFSLKHLLAADVDPLPEARFQIEKSISIQGGDELKGMEEIEVMSGDTPLSNPTEIADMISLDFSSINWDVTENDTTRLLKIEVKLSDGTRRFSKILKPDLASDGRVTLPENVSWMTNPGAFDKPGGVKAWVYFTTSDGKRISWEYNDKDLRDQFPDKTIVFFDEDWRNRD